MKVTIHEAKTNLSKLIQAAVYGEQVIISKGKTPMVMLTPIAPIPPERRLGGAGEVIQFMSDDFNAEIDDFDDV